MTETEFWHLVDSTQAQASGNRDLQAAKLKHSVLQLSTVEYTDLLRHFLEAKHAIMRRDDLINAAYLANEQCLSLDALDYFCDWLIGSGSAAYQQAFKNPDAVIDLMRQHGHPSLEEFASALFCRNDEGPLENLSNRPAIKGRLWSPDEQRQRLPLLFQYSQV